MGENYIQVWDSGWCQWFPWWIRWGRTFRKRPKEISQCHNGWPRHQRVSDYCATYQNKEPLELQGTFDKKDLPDDWDEFAEDLFNFLTLLWFCGYFDSKFYGKRMRCEDDVIHLKVKFDSNERLHSYRTDDDSIVAGDDVIVPVGKGNEPKRLQRSLRRSTIKKTESRLSMER